MKFEEAIKYVKESMKIEKPILYKSNETLEIFVIRSKDEYYTWYQFYCMDKHREPQCFSAKTDKKQADNLFKALCDS